MGKHVGSSGTQITPILIFFSYYIQLLALYGVYLLIIGVNGLVESLRDAVSDYKKIEAQLSFTAFSIVSYIIVGTLLL